MAAVHAHSALRTVLTDQKQRHLGPFAVLTESNMLLPDPDNASDPYPISGSSFLSSDTDPSLPSPTGVSSPLSNDSIEFGNAAPFFIPAPRKPAPPSSNTRLYLDHGHSSSLSDIGEEESPRSKRARSRTPSPIASSPTIAPQSPPQWIERHEKRMSEFSNSSNLSTSPEPTWEGVDGMAGMSERLKADLAAMGDDSFDIDGPSGNRSSVVTLGDEEHMSQTLSKRAEQILADAKKRLTHMEGNLSKARTSLSSPSKSSPYLREHKEVGGLYKSISQGGDRRLLQGPGPRKLRPFHPVAKRIGASHTKNLSETSVPSKFPKFGQPGETRPASAMEYASSGTSIDSMLQDRSHDALAKKHAHSRNRYSAIPLPILQESRGRPSTELPSVEVVSGQHTTRGGHESHSRNQIHDTVFGLTRSQSQISTRELRDYLTDTNQQRVDGAEIQATEKARRKSFQNLRSQPSFAAAKEWYVGALEYNGGGSLLSTNAGTGWRYRKGQQERSTYSPTSPQSPDILQLPRLPGSPFLEQDSPLDDTQNYRRKSGSYAESPNPRSFLRSVDDDRDDQTSYIQDYHYEDALEGQSEEVDESIAASEEEQIYLNEVLEESLQDSESQPLPIAQTLDHAGGTARHEDRADAFDYENFFLHSALGNYSQTQYDDDDDGQVNSWAMAGSRLSYESTDSVETTRGPRGVAHAEQDYDDGDDGVGALRVQSDRRTFLDDELPTPTGPRPPFPPHLRNNSVDSLASTATFATATEGGDNGSETDGNSVSGDGLPAEILNWGQPPPATTNRHNSLPGSESRSSENLDPASEKASPPQAVRSVSPPQAARPLSGDTFGHSNTNHITTRAEAGDDRTDNDDEDYSDDKDSESAFDHRPPPNTEILISALITLANPDFQSAAPFTEADQELVINLLHSVGAVCEGINKGETAAVSAPAAQGDVYTDHQGLRRRLDLARRVLEGEEIKEG